MEYYVLFVFIFLVLLLTSFACTEQTKVYFAAVILFSIITIWITKWVKSLIFHLIYYCCTKP